MVNPNIVIPSVIGGSLLTYGAYRMLKGRKKNMARKPEKGSEEMEEELEENVEELEKRIAKLKAKETVPDIESPETPVATVQPNQISEQEIIDMANGHLARAAQLLEFLKNLKAQ